MNTKPLVSVIIPCYNSSHFIKSTLQSVKNQTYTNWECIVVNDGSTDNSENIIKTNTISDIRFIYIYQKNKGLSGARNTGLNKSTGEYVLLLDADDILHPDKIKNSIELLLSEKSDMVITNFVRFKKNLQNIKKAHCNLTNVKFDYENILFNWDKEFTFPPHCVVFSKKIMSNSEFLEDLKAKEDWFFWIQLFSKRPKVSYINQVLVYYRKSEVSMTANSVHMKTNTKKAYKKIYDSIDENLKEKFLNKIIEDSSSKILYTEGKILKHKKIEKYLIILNILFLIVISLLVLFTCTSIAL